MTMGLRPLGRTGLSIPPLVLGGNVFGWTVDEATSFRLLDAALDHGLTAIDTADVYSAFAPGNQGGESETVIGRWLAAAPSRRDKVVICTKVGFAMGAQGPGGLSAGWINTAVEASLRRLHTDVIDLYYAHKPDPNTPYAETLEAFQRLIEAGKVRAIGGSNYGAAQLQEVLVVAKAEGLPRFEVLQPKYSLYDRDSFEGPLAEICLRDGLAVLPYFALASGFLTGKFRSKDDLESSARAHLVAPYLNPRGLRIVDALHAVAAARGATPAEVAIAWVGRQPGVTAPIVSATSLRQLESLARACKLSLSDEDLSALDLASALAP